ncbi:amino acid ABC transporter permease [Paenibacillus sp. PR3]|uniref:Amino acid ABC transporter permease n=1 Tax=Paenibacillus terricola TaxID=2763503 RepID=A0ABR8MXK8_9BACL|nr:amino acid ABC transporter permease [Paenibacillus terricola]MBD3919244.1 amino acid ABC transporter permease [Paenibacillus terricola]
MKLDYSVIMPFMPVFLEGAWMTVKLSVLSLALGLVLGIIGGLCKTSSIWPLRAVANLYTWIFRGTPLLVQLFILYFGLPQLGITMGPFQAGVLGMALNTGAYATEIVRSGLMAVDRGQSEAASALGMSRSVALFRVIGPQAIKVIIPPLVNQFIMTIKNSSMVSLVTITELFRTGESVIVSTFRSFEVYSVIAIMYLIMTSILMIVAKQLEKGMSAHDRA